MHACLIWNTPVAVSLSIKLDPSVYGKTEERHSVAVMPNFWSAAAPRCAGAIVDNDPDMPVIMLEEKDYADKFAARQVFARLFPKGQVFITSVYCITKPGERGFSRLLLPAAHQLRLPCLQMCRSPTRRCHRCHHRT